MRSADFGWLIRAGLVGWIVCDGVLGEESRAANCSGSAFGESEDGCLDLITKSRRAAMRSVSDRRVTLLLSGVLGVADRGVARLLGLSPPMRLPSLPVFIGAGAAGTLDLENVRGESESDRGEPMRSPILSRFIGLD